MTTLEKAKIEDHLDLAMERAETLSDELARVTAQRDALLAACREVLVMDAAFTVQHLTAPLTDAWGKIVDMSAAKSAVFAARAAIALCEETPK